MEPYSTQWERRKGIVTKHYLSLVPLNQSDSGSEADDGWKIAEALAFAGVAILGIKGTALPRTTPEPIEVSHVMVPPEMDIKFGKLRKQERSQEEEGYSI